MSKKSLDRYNDTIQLSNVLKSFEGTDDYIDNLILRLILLQASDSSVKTKDRIVITRKRIECLGEAYEYLNYLPSPWSKVYSDYIKAWEESAFSGKK